MAAGFPADRASISTRSVRHDPSRIGAEAAWSDIAHLPDSRAKAHLLAALRERTGGSKNPATQEPSFSEASGMALCADLPGLRLSFAALHEVWVVHAWDIGAGLGFTLALASRIAGVRSGPVIWVRPARLAQERGVPHAPGLGGFGLDPGRLILLCPETDKDLLWGLEEAVKERRVSVVLGELPARTSGSPGYDLTASRRLQLAAERAGVPLLAFRGACSDQGPSGTSAARTRWSIRPNPLPQAREDPAVLSWVPRWQVTLMHCRQQGPDAVRQGSWHMEWDHEAYRFHLVAPLAHRASEPPVKERERPSPGAIAGTVERLVPRHVERPDLRPARRA